MVTNVTSLGRSGLFDWVIQRVSAVVLAAYTLCILGWFLLNPEPTFSGWSALFDSAGMRIFSLLALLSLVGHAWIGIWTVATDYLTPMALGNKATAVRFAVQCACAVLLFVYLVWGIEILWGN